MLDVKLQEANLKLLKTKANLDLVENKKNEFQGLLKEIVDAPFESEVDNVKVLESEKRKQEHKYQEKMQKIKRFFGQRFMKCTFDNYECKSDNQKTMIKSLKEYSLSKKENGESVFLYGKSGTGKSHILAAICREMNENFIAEEFAIIAEKKRVAIMNGQNWHNEVDVYCKIQMLIIPDLIIRDDGMTESQKELLAHIMEQRYKNLLPVMIATNMSTTEFGKKVDFDGVVRTSSRFTHMVGAKRHFMFSGENYRVR